MGYVTCPKCGERIKVNSCGRKKTEVPVNNIICAAQSSRRPDGSVNYADAARILVRMTGVTVSRSFVHCRIGKMAAEKGITREQLLARS